MTINNKNILVVDDEPDLRELVAFEFEVAGCNVFLAGNGKEAFDVYKTKEFDAVITDIRMPGGDGIELLDLIWKSSAKKKPSVIFITGFADVTVDEAYHRGAEGLFAKPYDRKALVKTVQNNLTPLEQRWSIAPIPKEEAKIRMSLRLKNFSNLSADGKVHLGRGGFFIAYDSEVPANPGDWVSFDCQCDKGEIKGLQGVGIVRWARRAAEENLPKGCGVEICYLDEGCRESVLKVLQKQEIRPFIPRA